MKRRFFAMLLSLAMLFTLAPTAFAADNTATDGEQTETPELTNPATEGTSGGIDWKVEGDTLTISPSKNPESDFASGQMVGNYGTLTKKAPGDAAYIAALTKAGYKPSDKGYFYYPNTETWVSDSPWKFLSEQITKVVVENGVSNIADRAFRLPNITEVSIPASVTSIGKLAFEACEKLTTVNWTGDWSNHATMAFNGFSRCSSLGEGHELTEWMPACFYVNANSDSIEGTKFTVDFDKLNRRLQNGTTYPRAMFRSVPKITSATLTSQLNNEYIFEYSGIQSVTIADDQTNIATAAFRGCEGLTSVTIPASVTVIHMRAFADSGLKNITFSGSTSPTFGPVAFENVKLDSVTLNENMSLTEAVKIIGELVKEGAITDSTTITPAKFANFNAENVVVDGTEGDAINRQSYPLVKNLTINGAYTSAVGAFGNSVWGKETLEVLTIHAPGKEVTINATAFLRTPLKSVKIEAEKLTFAGDAAFLNTMLLTHIDLTGVDEITLGAGGKRTFDINDTNNGNKSAPTRYVYFKDDTAYNIIHNQFGGNTATYYLVTNGGTVVGEQDGFSAVVKGGYTAEWHATADFSDDAVATPKAGKVYYAKWKKSDSVVLSSSLVADGSGNVSATYNPNGAITLSVQNPGADWLYTWMKDGKQISVAGNSLTLYTPSESGKYSVQIMTKGSKPLIWTSNPVNVTITKAAVANTAKQNVRHTFGTTYDVSNLFGIDPNAGKATYALVENPDENAGAATLEGNILTITKAGVIKVRLTTAETDNYNAGSAVTATLTVDKATPSIKISADQTSLTGSGTVKLTVSGAPTEGSVNVTCDNGITVNNDGGTFTATLPNQTKTYTFTANYTGATNYNNDNSAKCTVTVTHHSSGSSSSNPTYSVTTPSKSENGGVAVSSKNARKGDTVTVTVTPDAGYQLDKLTVTDKNGNVLKLTDKGDGKYSFTMPDGKVEIKAVFAKKVETSPFGDVSADAYYYKAVQWAQEKGITDGISSDLFGPKQPCTRSQIVTFLWRAAGSPEPKGTAAGMTDVVPGSYYAKAVAWAVENGITTGTAEGTFSPDATCTRAQAVTFLARAQNAKATGKTAFSDVPADSYFADAVAWAQANGVTTGTSETTFSPDSDCTRAQIVTFLYRANQGT